MQCLALLIWIGFGVEFPHVKDSIATTRDKTSIVFKPADTLHWLDMAFKLELNRTFCRVKLIHPDLLIILACKEMATM